MVSHCKHFTAGLASLLLVCVVTAQPVLHCEVDQTPVIDIEDYHVSSYLLAKYFNSYARKAESLNGKRITDDEAEAWMKTFIAQQVIVAHLYKSNYNKRPDIMMSVSVMERHMLSLIGSQLDRSQEAPVSTDINELFHQSHIVRDLTVALFQDDGHAARELGPDFDKLSLDNQTKIIHRSADAEDITTFDGRRTWPFSPYLDIADEIVKAPIGRWTKIPAHGAPQVYYVLVKNITELPSPALHTQAREFGQLVEHIGDDAAARRRRLRLLSSSGFELYPSIATQLLKKLQTLPSKSSIIPISEVADIASAALFSCNCGSGIREVTVEEFCRDFNTRYFRTIPPDFGSLRIAAEDMAVDEINIGAATIAGVARSPKFLEDRLGFTRLQVLDAYEKETLLPQIAIQPDEVASYYSKHLDQFRNGSAVTTIAVAEPAIKKLLIRQALNEAEVQFVAGLQESPKLITRYTSADLIRAYGQSAQDDPGGIKAYIEAICAKK